MERTLTVRLDDELDRSLAEEAARLQVSKGEVVRETLRQRLKTREPTLYDLLKPLEGILKSGPADLSTNKKYMKDFGRRKKSAWR